MSYTEDDVQLVMDAIEAWLPFVDPVRQRGRLSSRREIAEQALKALTGAGRLRNDAGAHRSGYDVAIAVLRGVHERTGSPAAKWAADYLTADPDREAPAGRLLPEDTRTEVATRLFDAESALAELVKQADATEATRGPNWLAWSRARAVLAQIPAPGVGSWVPVPGK